MRREFRALGIAATIIVYAFLTTSVALADPIGAAVWYFNLPSTAVASQNPPYPLVATLTLTQTSEGVHFLLKPNWSNPKAGFSSQSFIEQVDYVYSGPGLRVGNFRWDAGAEVKSFSYDTNQNNMDSSYKTQDQHIRVDFGDKNDPFRFDNSLANSEWMVLNPNPSILILLSQFTGTFATSESKPSPTQGVISVTAYSLDDPNPTPSNWVTGPVPEPATLLLLGSGLLGLAGYGRKKFLKK